MLSLIDLAIYEILLSKANKMTT